MLGIGQKKQPSACSWPITNYTWWCNIIITWQLSEH